MHLLFIALCVFIQSELNAAQTQWVPPTTTAQEMRNPYTWYWPYAIAAADSYRNFFQNAQQIQNQLYQQAKATQAFPWATGQAGQLPGQAGGAAGQAGQTAGQWITPMIQDQEWSNDQGGQNWNPGQEGQNWNAPGF